MQFFVVAYVPVLHAGYLEFFRKYPNSQLYIFGPDITSEFSHLERDIRALSPYDMKLVVKALGIFSKVHVLDHDSLRSLGKSRRKIVLPDEDVSREIAARYFPKKRVIFESVFLRWDKKNTMSERVVSPDRIISTDAFDREMMNRAHKEALKSPDWWRQVGALVVKNGKVLFHAFNKHMPSEHSLYALGDPRGNFDWGERIDLSKALHAEVGVIAQAAKRGVSVDRAWLYITTFPCPPCALSIAEAGFERVYYKEGYSLIGAEETLRSYGVEIILIQNP